jgi:hypothetical protein
MIPSRILHDIITDNKKDYVYIILGRTGTTGKTWLCDNLKNNGFTAFEISEHIFEWVDYTDYNNHVVIDEINKQVTIVLNRPMEMKR